MATYIDHTEWIEAFLDGELSEEDRNTFVEKLQTDAAFRKAFEQQEATVLALRVKDRMETREAFREIFAGIKTNQEKKNRNIRPLYFLSTIAVAAIIIVLIWVYIPSEKITPDTLANQYFQPYEIEALRNASPSVSSPYLQKGRSFYQHKRYDSAVVYLEKTLVGISQGSIQTNIETTRLLLGISYLAQNQIQPALESFQELANSLEYEEHARWYSALAYLKSGQITKAHELLETIVQADIHFKKDPEAVDLLKQVQSLL